MSMESMTGWTIDTAKRHFSLCVLLLTATWISKVPGQQPISNRPIQISDFGLEMVNQRATDESWTLARSSTYKSSASDDSVQRARAAYRLATQQRFAGSSLALDTDLDGRDDWWAYYEGGVPAFLETDRFGTGCHDLRIDLRTKNWTAEEFHGWAVKPPLPITFESTPDIQFSDLYDWAGRTELGGERETSLATANLRLFPDLDREISRLVGESDPALAGRLDSVARKAQTLIPQFLRVHQQERFRESLVRENRIESKHVPYDLDGKPGREVVAVYWPWGVQSIRFFQDDWAKDKQTLSQPLAEVFFLGREILQVQLASNQFFRVRSHWLRVDSQARKRIAEECLWKGYSQFQRQHFYAAIAYWEHGLTLAGILGDLQSSAKGTFTNPVSQHIGDRWEFEVDGINGFDLLQVSDAIARRHAVPDFYSIAEQLREKGEYARALDVYQVALTFAEKDRDAVSQANILDGLAAVYRRLGHYDRAIESLFRSLDIESSLAYSSGIARNLRNLVQEGNPHSELRALESRSHAMAVNRTCKMATIARLYLELNEIEKAKTYLEEAERLNARLQNQFIAADMLTIRADLNLDAGQYDLAERRLTRAIQLVDASLARQTADSFGQEKLADGYALHQFRVDYPRGYDLVDMKSQTHPLSIKASIAGMLAELFLVRTDESGEAAADYQEAIRWEDLAGHWSQQAGDEEGRIGSRFRMAAIVAAEGRYDDASEQLSGVITAARELQMFETLWRALHLRAVVAAEQDDVATAITMLEKAAAEIESLRSRIYSEPVRRGYFGSKVNVYEQLALMYLRQKGEADSHEIDRKIWQCMERAKARTLLDIVGGENLRIRGQDVIATRQTANRFGETLMSYGVARGVSPRQENIRDFVNSLADRPQLQEVASLSTVQTTRLADVQHLLDDGILIEYLQTENKLLAAVISRNRLQIVVLDDLSRTRIAGDVKTFREIMQDPLSSYETSGKQLYTHLVAPCLKGHPGLKRICFVPSGSLHYIPFGAFVLPTSEFLVERFEIHYAASASTLVYSAHRHREQNSGSGTTLIVANPQPHADYDSLPFAESEGQEIARIAPQAKLLSSSHATESLISAQLPQAKFFHFAGHTHLRPDSPMRTALMCTEDLEDDGRLEVRELFSMDLPHCELAVLSACETRLGQIRRGDEIVGLERAFLRAGVPTVVASLWQVDDAATQALMVEYYRNLIEKNQGKAEALHESQRAMIEGSLLAHVEQANRALGKAAPLPPSTTAKPDQRRAARHPRYWASFVLTGYWK